jgi:hypothetical protein
LPIIEAIYMTSSTDVEAQLTVERAASATSCSSCEGGIALEPSASWGNIPRRVISCLLRSGRGSLDGLVA